LSGVIILLRSSNAYSLSYFSRELNNDVTAEAVIVVGNSTISSFILVNREFISLISWLNPSIEFEARILITWLSLARLRSNEKMSS